MKKTLLLFFKIIYNKWVFGAVNIYLLGDTIIECFKINIPTEPFSFWSIIFCIYISFGFGLLVYKRTKKFRLRNRLSIFFLIIAFSFYIVVTSSEKNFASNLLAYLGVYVFLGFVSVFLICFFYDGFKSLVSFHFKPVKMFKLKKQVLLFSKKDITKPNYSPKLYFKIDFSTFPLKIQIKNNQGFIEEKNKEVNKLIKRKSYSTYLEKVFQAINNCNFIIFESPKAEFVQYWLGNGIYWFDFPITEYTGNKNNLAELTSVLKKYEFKERVSEEIELNDYEYCLNKTDEIFALNANFGKNKDLVLAFTCEVLKEIFKVPLKKLEIKVG